MRWSSTGATATPMRSSSRWGAAWPISPSTTMRCASAPSLKGKASWFLPFNRGWNDGAGNPPNPNGLKTDYLWKQALTRDGLTDIIENYAQIVESRDERTGRKKRVQIWPRYHQLDVVRRLLADVAEKGIGVRYLIQHSAGSGKSNSIAWLAHQLIGLERDGGALLDSVVVVTDRKVLDRQIRDTIRQFAQVRSIVGHAEHSGDLRTFLQEGKKIVITTVQKFPFILDAIGDEHRGRRFAIIIDEAHSSQGGRTSAAVSMALGEAGAEEEDPTTEDKINRLMESRKLLPNASYFAFTATPKNKTLEIFGEPGPQPDGKVRRWPFHSYTMKQAIQEGFIIDVLERYTPVDSYYRLVKTVEGDPEFDTKRARKKLRRYVENHEHAIHLKAEIMVDHFHEQVVGLRKIGGQARAMVVTGSIERAIRYYHAIGDYLAERKSPHQPIVAFSGEHEYGGAKVTEALLNGLPVNCALPMSFGKTHTGSWSAPKSFRRATTSRCCTRCTWTRYCPASGRCRHFRASTGRTPRSMTPSCSTSRTTPMRFRMPLPPTTGRRYSRKRPIPTSCTISRRRSMAIRSTTRRGSTSLSSATSRGSTATGSTRSSTPVWRSTGSSWMRTAKVDFKGKAKGFLRAYGFLASILPYTYAEWEKLSIFLTFLVPKLPAPC